MLAPWKTFRIHAWNVTITAYPWDTEGYQPDVSVGVPLPNPGSVDLTWRQVYGESLLLINSGGTRWSGNDTPERAVWVAGGYTTQEREILSETAHDPPEGYHFSTANPPEITSVAWVGNQTLYPYQWRYPLTGQVIYRLEGTFDQVESKLIVDNETYKAGASAAPIVGAFLLLLPLLCSSVSASNGNGTPPGRRRRKS